MVVVLSFGNVLLVMFGSAALFASLGVWPWAAITRTTKTTDNAEKKSTPPELHARPDYAVPFPWLPVVPYLGRLTARQNASYVQLSYRQKTTFFHVGTGQIYT